jgi:hypothetical protein
VPKPQIDSRCSPTAVYWFPPHLLDAGLAEGWRVSTAMMCAPLFHNERIVFVMTASVGSLMGAGYKIQSISTLLTYLLLILSVPSYNGVTVNFPNHGESSCSTRFEQ